MEVWKIVFHSILEIFHSIPFWHLPYSIPKFLFHFPFHSIPCPGCNTKVTPRTDANYWEGCSRNFFGGCHLLDRQFPVLMKLYAIQKQNRHSSIITELFIFLLWLVIHNCVLLATVFIIEVPILNFAHIFFWSFLLSVVCSCYASCNHVLLNEKIYAIFSAIVELAALLSIFQYVRDSLLSAFIQKSFKVGFHAQFLTFLIIQINSICLPTR